MFLVILFASLTCKPYSNNICSALEFQLCDSCKCNYNCWPDFGKTDYNLNDDQILSFLYSLGEECKNNVEFSEWSNEVLFNIVLANPEIFLKVMDSYSTNIELDWILKELEDPISDVIIKEIYEKINNVNEYDSTKKLIIKSLQIALDRNQY